MNLNRNYKEIVSKKLVLVENTQVISVSKLAIKCMAGDISDGYNSFSNVYGSIIYNDFIIIEFHKKYHEDNLHHYIVYFGTKLINININIYNESDTTREHTESQFSNSIIFKYSFKQKSNTLIHFTCLFSQTP